jgi:hypothetical protein
MGEDERTRRDGEAPDRDPPAKPPDKEPPETARRPAPGIEHEPEPSGENLIPAKNRPGTL